MTLNRFIIEFIPEMKIKLLKIWNKYLEKLNITPIRSFRNKFFEEFSLLARKKCFSEDKITMESEVEIQGVLIR